MKKVIKLCAVKALAIGIAFVLTLLSEAATQKVGDDTGCCGVVQEGHLCQEFLL